MELDRRPVHLLRHGGLGADRLPDAARGALRGGRQEHQAILERGQRGGHGGGWPARGRLDVRPAGRRGQRRLPGGRAPRPAGAGAGAGALLDPHPGAGLAASAGARWARLERWSLMRAVIQRVNRAAVRVDGEVVGEITRPGLMVLVGATHDDGPTQVATVARKIADLRLLEGELSVTDAGAPVLVVSQFTLYADTRKGRRPTWNKAAPGEVAEPLVEAVAEDLRGRGLEVATGRFGADMKIDMEADGPVTILIETE